MAAFFQTSSDLLNPFLYPTRTIQPHNHQFYNLCFGSTQDRPRNKVDHIEEGNSPFSTFSSGGVFTGLAPTYLRAAQELLNEIVNIGNSSYVAKLERPMSKEKGNYRGWDINVGHKPDLAAYRQDLQIKKTKLISMVQKLEERYKQYQDQMETLISLSEQVAGLGSANSYTQVALQTMSKQFGSVKDKICLQIKNINKMLEKKECEVEELKKMTHYHSNVWGPQRGLPEKAVSVLRSWLFEHFLHPYPRDLDKAMLAKQTGLTKSQVSNWFINARVRVWKPMVEKLYMEEMNIEERKKRSNPNEQSTKDSSSKQPYTKTTSDESLKSIFHQGNNTEYETSMQNSSSSCNVVRFMNKTQHMMNQANNFIHFSEGFENYYEMVRNSVSLSLGLPHSRDQRFSNIQFGSTSHETEISGLYPSLTYRIVD